MNISFDELSEGVKQDFLAWVNRKFEPYPSYQQLDAATQALYLQMYIRECKGVLVVSGTITKTGWQCPACGVGVRGDVEVCPNCVKRAEGKHKQVITEGNDSIRAGGANIERFG